MSGAAIVRPLRDGEVHLLWLEVRRRVNAAGRARAWRDLAEATKRGEDATEAPRTVRFQLAPKRATDGAPQQ